MSSTAENGFSWQVAHDLRISVLYRTPTTIDVAVFENSELAAGAAPWAPDHPFDQDHGIFEALQRHCGENASTVLGLLNAKLAKLHQQCR